MLFLPKKTWQFTLLSLTFCLSFCSSIAAYATRIRGFLTDSQNNPLAFATIFVKGANLTTSTNEDGFFAIDLPQGTYFMVFHYIGYKETQLKIEVGTEPIELQVQLASQTLQLDEVVITTQDNDLAYGIIKKAQAKRKYYLNEEIKSYQCNAYIKGLQRISKKPNRILGTKITLDTGVVYFSESYSELQYKQPNNYKEKMLSSKVSGKSQAFSFNQASGAWVNLYDNIISDVGLGERGIVSPLAPNALSYYRYRLEGAFYENGQLVNKIKIIPRRKNAPAFAGYIYIIENSWRLHSTDLYVPKGTVPYVDSVTIQQVYLPHPQQQDIWIPASQKANFSFKAFGIEGKGYFIFIFSNYTLEPAFPKKTFTQEVFSIAPEANKRDSVYWEKLRPIPLTPEERKEYKIKDSLEIVKESKPYKDSVDRKNNKYTWGSLIFGYTYRNSFDKWQLTLPSLAKLMQYNTVEGWVFNAETSFRQNFENRTYWRIQPTLRYGVANQRWQAKVEGEVLFNPINRANLSMETGQFVEQISRFNSITPFLNTYYSLIHEQNYLKLYEKQFVKIRYFQEVSNGIYFSATTEWANRNPLQNNSNYRLIDIKDREFSSNIPSNAELANTDFSSHQALILNVGIALRIKQKYALYPNRKIITESKFPTLRINYRKGIAQKGISDIDYDLLTMQIDDNLDLGMLGALSYDIEAGSFLHKKRLFFMDYKHFLGNRLLFIGDDFKRFYLLDYYQYSTQEHYLKAHVEHHFNGFLTNSIPFLKQQNWQLVAKCNYLYTPALNHYAELGLGLEGIFKVLRLDVATAFPTPKPAWVVRFGIGF